VQKNMIIASLYPNNYLYLQLTIYHEKDSEDEIMAFQDEKEKQLAMFSKTFVESFTKLLLDEP